MMAWLSKLLPSPLDRTQGLACALLIVFVWALRLVPLEVLGIVVTLMVAISVRLIARAYMTERNLLSEVLEATWALAASAGVAVLWAALMRIWIGSETDPLIICAGAVCALLIKPSQGVRQALSFSFYSLLAGMAGAGWLLAQPIGIQWHGWPFLLALTLFIWSWWRHRRARLAQKDQTVTRASVERRGMR